jgi:hypothetical protein
MCSCETFNVCGFQQEIRFSKARKEITDETL